MTPAQHVRFQVGSGAPVNLAAADYDEVVTENNISYRQFDGTPGKVLVRAPAGSTVTGSGDNTIPHSISSDGVITLDMNTALINAVAGAVTGTTPVNINLSSLTGTAVSIPREFFEKVSSDTKTAQIQMPQGTILFSGGALTTVAAAGTAGGRIVISLHEQNTTALNAAQQGALIAATDRVFSITVTAGTRISSFNGILTITVPFTLTFPAEAWHMNDAGALTRPTSSSPNATARTVTFTTSTLSIYVIRGTAASGPNDPNVPQTSDDVNIFVLVIAAIVAVGGLVTLVVFRKRFLTEKR